MEHQEPTDPELEKVWELLQSAKPVEPSPFFSRNVVREVRRLEEEAPSGWILRVKAFLTATPARPVLIGAMSCAAVALTAVMLSTSDPLATGTPLAASAESDTFDPASEMAEVQYFGQLMAVADPAMLDDASLANLFF